MANVLTGNPWILDTVSSTPFYKGWVYVSQIQWEAPAGGADTCTIKDAAGRVVYQADCQSSSLTQQTSFGEAISVWGMALTALTSGTVYVYIK